MVKTGGFPVGIVVALLALLTHATGMGILRLVAAMTVLGNFVFHTASGMTADAVGTRVRPIQGKAGFFGVVELGCCPTERRMALLAVIAA